MFWHTRHGHVRWRLTLHAYLMRIYDVYRKKMKRRQLPASSRDATTRERSGTIILRLVSAVRLARTLVRFAVANELRTTWSCL